MGKVVSLMTRRRSSTKSLEQFKLVLVYHASFRSSEATNYDKARRRLGRDPKPGEVVLIHSLGGDQLIWVLGRHKFGKRTILDTRRWRLETGGTWNPLMLQNYAELVGLHLEGLKRFEEHHEKVREVMAKVMQS